MDARDFLTNDDDALRNVSLRYFLKGVALFNLKDYENAARNFWGGIVTLRKIKNEILRDDDRRNYIDLCINLSDSYTHLFKHQEAQGAFEEAINMFPHIKEKTLTELQIKNAEMFRQHFEKKLSSPGYLNSNRFKVHSAELYQIHTENTLDIGGLSLNNGMQQQFFAATSSATPFVASFNTQDDDNYRKTAAHFITSGRQYEYHSKTQEAEAAFKEALKAYQLINAKSAADHQVISQLKDKIDMVNKSDLANQMSRLGFSSQQQTMTTPSAPPSTPTHNSDDDEMDYEDNDDEDDRNRFQQNR